MRVYIHNIIVGINVSKKLVNNKSVMLFVTGTFYVIIEYCRFGCLRQYIIDKQDDFIDTMDDVCKREPKQDAQPRIPPDPRYVSISHGTDKRAELTIGINDDVVPLTTKDLVCYLFQIARGMEFLASRKVGNLLEITIYSIILHKSITGDVSN